MIRFSLGKWWSVSLLIRNNLACFLSFGFYEPVGSLCQTSVLSVVRYVSSVSTTTKSIFAENINHVPGLCLLGIIGSSTLITELGSRNISHFHISNFFSQTIISWLFIIIMAEDCLYLGNLSLLKL